MRGSGRNSSVQIARIVRNCLERGGAVEIDGLGAFQPDAAGGFTFVPQVRPRVFLAYVLEDRGTAERLYDELISAGFDPWMDTRKLLPGQNWPRAIERAISISDFFIACLSSRSAAKRGMFQAELRYALDCATHVPFEDVFFIPVRIEECEVPPRISAGFQYVDLFPDWERGMHRVVGAIRKHWRLRHKTGR